MKLPDPPVGRTAALCYKVNRAKDLLDECRDYSGSSPVWSMLGPVLRVGVPLDWICHLEPVSSDVQLQKDGSWAKPKSQANQRKAAKVHKSEKGRSGARNPLLETNRDAVRLEAVIRETFPPLAVIRLEHQRAPESRGTQALRASAVLGINKREPRRGIQGRKKKNNPEMSRRRRPHVIFYNESKRGH